MILYIPCTVWGSSFCSQLLLYSRRTLTLSNKMLELILYYGPQFVEVPRDRNVMDTSVLITGDELASILALNLPDIKLDQYVRVRRIGASHKQAMNVASFDYIRVRDYSRARSNGLSHRQIMSLAQEGYKLYFINECIDEGYALRCAKQAYKSEMLAKDYIFLRKKGFTHAKIIELAQMRVNSEYRKWKLFIARIEQGMSLEAALHFEHDPDDD